MYIQREFISPFFFLISEMSYSTCSVNKKLIISAIWKLPRLYNLKKNTSATNTRHALLSSHEIKAFQVAGQILGNRGSALHAVCGFASSK